MPLEIISTLTYTHSVCNSPDALPCWLLAALSVLPQMVIVPTTNKCTITMTLHTTCVSHTWNSKQKQNEVPSSHADPGCLASTLWVGMHAYMHARTHPHTYTHEHIHTQKQKSKAKSLAGHADPVEILGCLDMWSGSVSQCWQTTWWGLCHAPGWWCGHLKSPRPHPFANINSSLSPGTYWCYGWHQVPIYTAG